MDQMNTKVARSHTAIVRTPRWKRTAYMLVSHAAGMVIGLWVVAWTLAGLEALAAAF